MSQLRQDLKPFKHQYVGEKNERSLRSEDVGFLVGLRVCKSRTGPRAFSYEAPILWNHPVSVREQTQSVHLRVDLKPFLAGSGRLLVTPL